MSQKYKQRLLPYKRVIFLIGLPIAIVAVSLVITNLYYRNENIKKLREFYSYAMRQTAVRCEERINSVVDNGEFFLREELLDRCMNDQTPPDGEEAGRIQRYFERFQMSGDIVDSMYIFNVEEKYIVGDGGVFSLAAWFLERDVYANYSIGYWNNIRFFDSAPYKVLSPTLLKRNEEDRIVLPVLLKWSNGERSKNILVINLSFDDLIMLDQSETFYGDFKILMLNRYNGSVFGDREDGSEVRNIANTELYRGLVSGKETFDCTLEDGKRVTIISYATSNKLVGYTYFTVIPESYINKMQLPNLLLSFGIGGAFFLIALYFAIRGGGAILMPYRKLLKGDEGDILKRAESEIESLIQKDEEMKVVLPFVRERYLINFLNSDDYYLKDEVREALGNMLSFPNDYFAVVAFLMQSTDRMHQNYTAEEYINIYTGFYGVVGEIFAEKFETQVLPAEKEMLYIILNAEQPREKHEVEEIVEDILKMLRTDMDCIDLFFGISGFYETIDGLKKAHREAMDDLKLAPKPKIQFALYEKFNNNQTNLSSRNEASLFNMIMDGRLDEALGKLSELKEKAKDVEEKSKKQFYLQIFNVILRAMNMKGISIDGKMDYEIYADVSRKSAEEIYRKICVFIERFPERNEKQATRNKKEQIMQFIDENYQDPNLSREMIAERFHIQPNYLSILIKNKIGITFKDYLTNLRILHAKELLVQKEKSIQEIYEESGFASKQTFYRTFKNEVGLTPDEFRWNEKEEE